MSTWEAAESGEIDVVKYNFNRVWGLPGLKPNLEKFEAGQEHKSGVEKVRRGIGLELSDALAGALRETRTITTVS